MCPGPESIFTNRPFVITSEQSNDQQLPPKSPIRRQPVGDWLMHTLKIHGTRQILE